MPVVGRPGGGEPGRGEAVPWENARSHDQDEVKGPASWRRERPGRLGSCGQGVGSERS